MYLYLPFLDENRSLPNHASPERIYRGTKAPKSTPNTTEKGGTIPMNYTQAQIDRANAVSLEDFLRTQGETLIKSGREYRWKEHDSHLT